MRPEVAVVGGAIVVAVAEVEVLGAGAVAIGRRCVAVVVVAGGVAVGGEDATRGAIADGSHVLARHAR